MNINLSGFRQEVSKVRLSETAFNELLNATNALEVGGQNERLDMRPACIDPIRHHVLSTELRNLRDLIDHERHVLILDGFKTKDLASFKSLVWTFGSLLGAPMIQNHLGHKVIEVYDRGSRRIEEGARYHLLSFSDEGIPLIRYFRVYIESAHLKAGVPLTSAQTQALNFLDTALDQSSVQYRVLLEPGQMLISADNKFLHTRTHFIDTNAARENIDDAEPLSGLNRYMLRMWLRKQ